MAGGPSSKARHRGRLFRRAIGCALAILASPAGARASAWNRLPGQGLVIADVTFGGGSRYFNGLGHLVPARSYAKRELDTYVEYGLTDWLTAIVKPSLVSTSLGSPDAANYRGLGTSEAGAQVHLLTFGPAVFAAQGTFRLPATTKEDNPALIGNTSRDALVKALAGVGFLVGSWPSFADLQAGYGIRTGRGTGRMARGPDAWHAPHPSAPAAAAGFQHDPAGAGTSVVPALALLQARRHGGLRPVGVLVGRDRRFFHHRRDRRPAGAWRQDGPVV